MHLCKYNIRKSDSNAEIWMLKESSPKFNSVHLLVNIISKLLYKYKRVLFTPFKISNSKWNFVEWIRFRKFEFCDLTERVRREGSRISAFTLLNDFFLHFTDL